MINRRFLSCHKKDGQLSKQSRGANLKTSLTSIEPSIFENRSVWEAPCLKNQLSFFAWVVPSNCGILEKGTFTSGITILTGRYSIFGQKWLFWTYFLGYPDLGPFNITLTMGK